MGDRSCQSNCQEVSREGREAGMKKGIRRTEGREESKRIKEICAENDLVENVKFQVSENPNPEMELVQDGKNDVLGCASTKKCARMI